MNKFLIAGLGNVGLEYENTRHNIGFMILDHLVAQNNVAFELSKLAFLSSFRYKGRLIQCIKPTTYMNLSGKAIRYYLNKENIPLQNLLVIVDDLSLNLGTIRYRSKGSAAGHNGLKNVEELLNSIDYPRLKWGIGNDFPKGQQVKYVLSPFNEDEMSVVNLKMDDTINSIYSFCMQGVQKTMNQFNKKND